MTQLTTLDLNLDKHVLSSLNQLVLDADQAKPGAVTALRRYLEDHPEVWNSFGDLGNLALETWLNMVAGTDHLLRESVRLKVDDLRRELLGVAPSPLEKLIVDRIVVTKLQLDHAEAAFGQARQISSVELKMFERRLNGAQHRYLRSINALATLRKLTRPLLPMRSAGALEAKTAARISRLEPAAPLAIMNKPASLETAIPATINRRNAELEALPVDITT